MSTDTLPILWAVATAILLNFGTFTVSHRSVLRHGAEASRLLLRGFHGRCALRIIVPGPLRGLLRGAIQLLLRLVFLGYVSLKDFFEIGPEAGWSSGIIFASPKSS